LVVLIRTAFLPTLLIESETALVEDRGVSEKEQIKAAGAEVSAGHTEETASHQNACARP
jgi:hypothetical protein